MAEFIQKEWKLYLKKIFTVHMIVLFAGAVTGFLFLCLILSLDSESTYVYLGTIFSMLFAGGYAIVMAAELNKRFVLGVSFGQKRKNLIVCDLIYLFLLTISSYAGIFLFLVLEKYAYPVLFYGRGAEGTGMFLFMVKWGIPVIALFYLILWMLFTLYMKYNGLVFLIVYLLGMSISILVSRFPGAATMASAVLLALSMLPAAVWAACGIVSGVLIVLINSGILMKIDVKY